jgi:hypothetical protein
MVGEAFAGLSAFKTMFDLAKGLKDISDANTRNTVAIELQEKILSAQAAQSELVERVRELEAALARFSAWAAEKNRYRLTDFGAGTFAYSLKPEEANGEPPHRICASCYQKDRKSILQFSHTSEGQDYFICAECKKPQAFGIYRRTELKDYEDDYISCRY